MSPSKKYSLRWMIPVTLVAVAVLLPVPYILWKYLAARNLDGSETYSNVHYMKEVNGKVGMELHLEFKGRRVLATLSDFDGTPVGSRTFLQGSNEGHRLVLKGRGPQGEVEITGMAQGAVFDGQITRWLGQGNAEKDKVQHPVLLKRVAAPGEERPQEE